jgi:hypothetical protein
MYLRSGCVRSGRFVGAGVEQVPRPSKAVHRQKISAASEWKRGNRKEAQKMWADADKARKELQAKKKKGKKPEAAESAESSEGSEDQG